jgi:predicted Fe-Mo cluster-binding NifX family protein
MFVLVDLESGQVESVDNVQNLQAAQGAGIQAAKTVADLGCGAVITGHVGPKAFVTLQAAGIDVWTNADGTVAEAIEQYRAGSLTRADGADVPGHWS